MKWKVFARVGFKFMTGFGVEDFCWWDILAASLLVLGEGGQWVGRPMVRFCIAQHSTIPIRLIGHVILA